MILHRVSIIREEGECLASYPGPLRRRGRRKSLVDGITCTINLPESIRILYHCTKKPHGADIISCKYSLQLAWCMMIYILKYENMQKESEANMITQIPVIDKACATRMYQALTLPPLQRAWVWGESVLLHYGTGGDCTNVVGQASLYEGHDPHKVL